MGEWYGKYLNKKEKGSLREGDIKAQRSLYQITQAIPSHSSIVSDISSESIILGSKASMT